MREHLGGGEGMGGSLCFILLGLERQDLPCPALLLLSTEPKALWYTAGAKSELLFSLGASDLRHT